MLNVLFIYNYFRFYYLFVYFCSSAGPTESRKYSILKPGAPSVKSESAKVTSRRNSKGHVNKEEEEDEIRMVNIPSKRELEEKRRPSDTRDTGRQLYRISKKDIVNIQKIHS